MKRVRSADLVDMAVIPNVHFARSAEEGLFALKVKTKGSYNLASKKYVFERPKRHGIIHGIFLLSEQGIIQWTCWIFLASCFLQIYAGNHLLPYIQVGHNMK